MSMTSAALMRTQAVSPALISGIGGSCGVGCAESLGREGRRLHRPDGFGRAAPLVHVAQAGDRHTGRAAPSSAGGVVPSRIARATIAAEAGPVLMPHGPCPAHTKR